jgi:Uma2 family endonuclease
LVSEAPDIPPFSVPVSAATVDGFSRWAMSDRRPPHSQLCYAGGWIYIEMIEMDGLFISLPVTALTQEGFSAWAASKDFPRRGRVSFLEKEIFFDMSPEELLTHNAVKTEVNRVTSNLNVELNLGQFYTDRALVVNEKAKLSTEPDGVFVTWKSLRSKRVLLVPRKARHDEFTELRGSPDWVLEVISLTSEQADTRQLRQQYHRAGVAEYWLINARGEEIDFKILVRRPKGYVAAARRGGWQHSPVFGRSFRLERWTDPLGYWQYRLHVQPV